MSRQLEQSIVKTLAFFDVFNYPLTAEEIWKWLYCPGCGPEQIFSLAEIKETLDKSQWLQDKISRAEGFYALQGREHTYLIRKHHNNLAERKFARAVRLVKVYRYLPFIKMIAVCNTLAYSNAGEESDIDFFIITEKNKIWVVRFFTIAVVFLLGLRPTEKKSRDTFCLSFFISEADLNIKKIMLHPHDVYSPYWVKQLIPIYDPVGVYQEFLQVNQWTSHYLPNAYPNQFVEEVKDTKWSKFISYLLAFIICPPLIGRKFNIWYRRFQSVIIDRNLKELVNVDTRVIVNDQMLKFHDNDRRELFYKKWKERLRYLLFKDEAASK